MERRIRNTRRALAVALSCLALFAVAPHAAAGPLREAFLQRMAQHGQGDEGLLGAESERGPASLPAGIRIVRDVAYGPAPRQRFDVYAPPDAHDAPVILLVHGGAWMIGDKANRNVIENKVARWVPRGFVVMSDHPIH